MWLRAPVILTARAVAVLAIAGLTTPGIHAQKSQISVLTLHPTRREAPAVAILDRVTQNVLSAGHRERVDYYVEFIDVGRFPGEAYEKATRDYFRVKYANHAFDVIIAHTSTALEFAARHREELSSGAPIVFSAGTEVAVPPRATGLVSDLIFDRSLEIAMRLHPQLKRVVVIGGWTPHDQFYQIAAKKQFARFEGRVAFDYVTARSIPALLELVASLPGDAIIYYLSVTQDTAGQRFLPTEVLDRIAATASVPTYIWNAVGLNHGAVGGSLIDPEVLAQHTAELARRVVDGEPVESIPVTPLDANVVMFDWRQLRRWNIDESALPPGSTVLYRQPTPWERYRLYILGGISLIVLEAALIAGLLVHRARRLRTERVLLQSQQRLEASNVEIRDLAGRLIVAQEAERSRIARELHDDVSQQLAGLSIALSSIRHRLRAAGAGGGEEPAFTSLQERAVALAESVRHLSHDLHPGVLQHVGVDSALRGHCEEFTRQHGVGVSFVASGDFSAIGGDAKLCLYRVTQEALRNTAKHAAARHVEVRLTRTAEGVDLTIADDGQGFEPGAQDSHDAGLGLRSIHERVRQAGGNVTILASRGRGTTVQVRVPVEMAAGMSSAGVTA